VPRRHTRARTEHLAARRLRSLRHGGGLYEPHVGAQAYGTIAGAVKLAVRDADGKVRHFGAAAILHVAHSYCVGTVSRDRTAWTPRRVRQKAWAVAAALKRRVRVLKGSIRPGS
jgi:hypothetical protein